MQSLIGIHVNRFYKCLDCCSNSDKRTSEKKKTNQNKHLFSCFFPLSHNFHCLCFFFLFIRFFRYFHFESFFWHCIIDTCARLCVYTYAIGDCYFRSGIVSIQIGYTARDQTRTDEQITGLGGLVWFGLTNLRPNQISSIHKVNQLHATVECGFLMV